ncbi:hypothetical protein EV644_103661 [Kribbella orskensis]|uniref:Integrase n=2 Tax=Kribbellaceae TaxID=2726069 RepID=A0ABY2BTT2_9ACTN|nr:hypothetical protein EV642_1121 [Kribbella sp. VKM Ac-2500]TCO27957.1 hypothetical protein EV644_103661 [Kribbella orskensis]
MERRGHASSRAALIYIHTNDDRHESVAQKMSELIEKGLPEGPSEADPDDLPEASGT